MYKGLQWNRMSLPLILHLAGEKLMQHQEFKTIIFCPLPVFYYGVLAQVLRFKSILRKIKSIVMSPAPLQNKEL